MSMSDTIKNKVAIITDSCADLPESYFKKNNIDTINMSLIFNEKEYLSDVYWKSIDAKTLYSELRDGTFMYTLPAAELEIRTVFEKHIKAGESIVYIACPKELSTTITKARDIANELLLENPKAEIIIIDALNVSCGQGILVLKACSLRDEGKNASEIAENIMAERNNVLEYCSPALLVYLSNANKIRAYTASLGDLLNIKPIIVSDTQGKQVSLKKIKGRENCLREIVRLMEKNAIDLEDQTVFIAHADDERIADHLKELMEAKAIKCKEVVSVCFGPVVGISAGPGAVAVFLTGKETTFTGA